MTSGDKSSYRPALDGIRAAAITCVFGLHLTQSHVPGGGIGVDIFFVLSAYLITGILLAEQASTGRISFRSFYWRRARRLAPALLLWLVCLATPTAILAGQGSKVGWSLAAVGLYVSNFVEAAGGPIASAFDQAWSLSLEEQFYLIWPAVLAFGAAAMLRRTAPLLAAGAVVAALLTSNYFLPTAHLVPLAFGCWAAVHRGRLIRFPVEVPAVLVLGVVLVVVPTEGNYRVSQLAVSALTALLLLRLDAYPTSRAARLLGSPLPRWVGERSYGVYLYGLTLIQLVPILTGLRLTYCIPLDVAATGLMVAASYRWGELPARRYGRTRPADRQVLVA